MREKISFTPADLWPDGNGRVPAETDPGKLERLKEISGKVSALGFTGKLGVPAQRAIIYVALGGDDKKFLKFCKGDPDPRINDYATSLPELRSLKAEHHELFE